MPKESDPWIERTIFAALRCAALACIALACYGLVVHAIESFYRFDPNYLGVFLLSKLTRPLVLLALAIALWFGSAKLARLASRR